MGTYGTALALVGTQVNILPLLLYAKIGDGGADFPATAALSLSFFSPCASLMFWAADHFSRRREHAQFWSGPVIEALDRLDCLLFYLPVIELNSKVGR